MTIVVNGKRRHLKTSASVRELVESLGLPWDRVIIEFNGEPLHRQRFSATMLHEGDKLEVAQMVGGG